MVPTGDSIVVRAAVYVLYEEYGEAGRETLMRAKQEAERSGHQQAVSIIDDVSRSAHFGETQRPDQVEPAAPRR